MSTLQLLVAELAGRTDSALLRLLSRRPELLDPPAADFAALAARAASRVGLARALDRLNQPQLQVLTALVVTAHPTSGSTSTALAAAVNGATTEDVQIILDQLRELALVLPVPLKPSASPEKNDAGNRHFLPVTSLREVLGAHPAGLGRSYRELASAVPGCREKLAAAVPRLETAIGRTESQRSEGSESDPVDALRSFITSLSSAEQLLRLAPAGATDLLTALNHDPLSAQKSSATTQGLSNADQPSPTGPMSPAGPVSPPAAVSTPAPASPAAVAWLEAHGLIVLLDKSHVELPREVGLLLRGGCVITHFAPAPPPATFPTVRSSVRDNAAMGAVAAVVRTMAKLLTILSDAPLPTLRAGGVGVRAVRTVAKQMDQEIAQSYFYLELAAMSSLISLDSDSSQWIVTADNWHSRERNEQWLWLISAWLDAPRLPALVGTAPPNVNLGQVLAADAHRPDAPLLRNSTLDVLASIWSPATASRADGDCLVPAPTPLQLLEHYRWYHPRPGRRIAKLLPGFLVEAETLGLIGAGALTDAGAAVIDRDWDTALRLVAAALPTPVDHVLLLGDLTAIAPGFLSPALSGELALLADSEGKGAANIYRFSTSTIERALAAGRTGPDILDFLTQHSTTPVPQPLEYLIRDTAARHGRFTIGRATSYITAQNPELLTELLTVDAQTQLAFTVIAPTVAISALTATEIAAILRRCGISPSLIAGTTEDHPDQAGHRAGRTQVPVQHAAFAPYEIAHAKAVLAEADLAEVAPSEADDAVVLGSEVEPPGTVVLGGEAARAQVRLLRSKDEWSPGTGESATAMVLENLRQAMESDSLLLLATVASNGTQERVVAHALSLKEGQLRVAGANGGQQRWIPVSRIITAELIVDDIKGGS